MCCNQKRSALRNSVVGVRPAVPTRNSAVRPFIGQGSSTPRIAIHGPAISLSHPAASSGVVVRYLEQAPLRVRGPVSGRSYDFSASRLEQPVDRRDLGGLLSTGLFQIKG